MSNIKTFAFNESGFEQLKHESYQYGVDWPVVYIIEDSENKEAYVGETINVFSRSKQHYDLPERKKLKNIHVITGSTYNKSATLDLESSLIQYMAADGSRVLQNANGGLKNHNFYDKEVYQSKLATIWGWLKKQKIVHKEIIDIENSDLFKYSPYKSLTESQANFVKDIFADIKDNKATTYIVNGQPGTGKTVLATYLVKYLKEHKETKHLKIGLVIPVGSLRKTIKSVFTNIKGLSAKMVVTPSEVAREDFDLVIVDEAHRLKRRKNLGAAFGAYDKTNIALGLDKEATHLDWIMKKSKSQVFFYDKDQSVMPSDIGPDQFSVVKALHYNLTEQLRVAAGEKYINFIINLLNVRNTDVGFGKHDLKLYDNLQKMVDDIKKKDKKFGLSRMVAGYAWPWVSNPNRSESPAEFDIEIDGCKLKWNSVAEDWVNSVNSVNEVGCIHTTQGYDLNYVGVIIGPELSYDPILKQMVVNKSHYHDRNGHAGVTDPKELERYIINIYKTLLVRGIKGTYIYVVDENLREYFRTHVVTRQVELENELSPKEIEKPIISPYKQESVALPLYDSIGCGEATYADPVSHESYEVSKALVRPGAKYFVLRTNGDSMNKLDINDGDFILCQKNYQAASGSIAVVLIGDDATLKEIKYESDGLLMIPRSTNPTHYPYKLVEGDEFKVLGTFVRKLERPED